MMPATIIARPEDLERRSDPDILPLPPAPRTAAARAAGETITGRDIVNALRYHSVLFVTLGSLVAAGLGALAWWLVPAKYTTYAMILVSQNDPRILPSAVHDTTGRVEFATYLKTQANMIKSSRTMIGALRDPKIARTPMLARQEDPISFLEEKILTEFSDTSQVLKVLLTGEDPVEIAAIVNAVVDYYIKEKRQETETKNYRLEVLRKKKADVENILNAKLKKSETDQLLGNGPGESIAMKQRLKMAEYTSLQQHKSQVAMALANARAELARQQAALKQFDDSPPSVPDLGERLDNDPQIRDKKAAITRLEGQINHHRRFASDPDSHPYPELKRRLDRATAELAELRQKVRATVDGDYRLALRQKLLAEVEKVQSDVARFEEMDRQTLERLAAEFKEFESPEADQRSAAAKMQAADEIARWRKELDRIDSTMLEMQVEIDAPERVSLYQRAEVPQKREMKKQIAITAVAGLLGFALVGGLITLSETRRPRVFGPADPLFQKSLPLLGCLPEHAAPAPRVDLTRLDALDVASRSFFEAVDKIKAVVCRQLLRRRMQAILVTSAAPEEGKSILAWNLALSFARTDKRTLFVDGNLRNPGLHNHFDIASHPGLSELLRGEATFQGVVQRTPLDNLWCVAAGVCDESARQALDKERMRRMLERARQDFDVIVIDCCSIREAVDPLYLAQRVDASVLSVRTFHSRTADVERACHRLSQLGTPLLGAVLMDSSGAAAVEL